MPTATKGLRDVLVALPEMVRVSPRLGAVTLLTQGSGVANGPQFGDAGSAENNEAGTAIGWNLQTPSGTGSQAGIRMSFYGSTVGVILRRDTQTILPPDYVVDGRIIDGGDTRYRFYNGTPSLVDGESLVIVAREIPDTPDGRPHTLDILLPPDLVGATTNKTAFYGLLVEKRAGYRPPRDSYAPLAPAAVPTSLTAITQLPSGATSDRQMRFVRKVIYTNTTAAGIAVNVQDNATIAWQPETVDGKVPPNGSSVLDFGGPTPIDTSRWKHIAAGAGLNFTVIGAW